MPIVPFEALPDTARVWVFASDPALDGAPADTLLASVDRFLSQWKAHGAPLICARDWRADRFLAIGVDVSAENASGCSIDGLFRTLQQLERELGARLVGGGRVFYRTAGGIQAATRDELAANIALGAVSKETPMFDTSVTDAHAWRTKFELPAAESWTRAYFASK